ncbi:uncharacterized protein L969DRAFT_45883 [Mixia osmundae IAM 14324]|uniref:Uncharacterized protein n=1 Tax=Mixia osmundae (strain CBS 9802 / IAM 14324 / JCM 22182 / KY 12970) TaxID=764103 RepID=G7E5E6_MIXOS|nr:uncharacterized protein L969DRAFT_45883 [Mixia osmundae IAM 14324]KEI40793.1 hypothetical protein L969DRAFT_45883 [Mixia osmundae IAM 14324]GAA98056.1 hypothetical protein E5Q_04737 [Mixia osmundae IAM 14324]
MLTTSFVFAALASAALATPHLHAKKDAFHSGCYAYETEKGAHFSISSGAVKYFNDKHSSKDILGPKTVNDSPGICGHYYDSTEIIGACLWSGTGNGADPAASGWLSGSVSENCGKKVSIKNAANGAEVVATVVDGCGLYAKDFKSGCPQVWTTIAAFNKLATKEEAEKSEIAKLEWKWLDQPI